MAGDRPAGLRTNHRGAGVRLAALQCTQTPAGCGQCEACKQVMAGNHPDVSFVSTNKVAYQIEDVRHLITRAQERAGKGKWRIIIIEDADRMTERTTNVLLKAIEEPPAMMIWILCAPSPADVLVTIRSRLAEQLICRCPPPPTWQTS